MDKKIELMIIGAQKAGTTSLNHYLSQHPEIHTHSTIEFGMFANIASYNKGFKYYYKTTVPELEKNDINKNKFVAKRVGLMYNKELLLKLKEHNPDVKIILILRNPVERAFSAFHYCRSNGLETYKNFNDAVFDNDESRFGGNQDIKKNCQYIYRSKYLEHIKAVFSVFPLKNIKLFLFEEMIKSYDKALNEMIALLNLDYFRFNVSIKYNERQDVRSLFLSKLLAPGKIGAVKYAVPFKARLRIRQTLKDLNFTKMNIQIQDAIDADTRYYLQNIFKQEVIELQQLTQLPLKQYWPEFFNK